MKRYCCQFPECEYKTNKRNLIDLHHIIPKELGGKDDEWNRIYLCPNHHRKTYIPDSKDGYHSIKHEDSITLIKKHFSTGRYVLEYLDRNNQTILKPVKNQK